VLLGKNIINVSCSLLSEEALIRRVLETLLFVARFNDDVLGRDPRRSESGRVSRNFVFLSGK